VLCGAVFGAGLGFLWFNAPPASIFMGDTGSLALGGMLGSIAVAVKHEIVLAVIGGLFVLEAVSVIVQVVSFKLTGKRVFRMAPIHHHFEQKGWTEPQIVIRFLDHFGDAGAGRPLHAEAAVIAVHVLRHSGAAQRQPGISMPLSCCLSTLKLRWWSCRPFTVIPGRCASIEPGISGFRVAAARPRNDRDKFMIPVTSFAGKTVAVFGLGGSGLASCHALKAGGAEVVAGDDNADNVVKAVQAGFITADLRKYPGRISRPWC